MRVRLLDTSALRALLARRSDALLRRVEAAAPGSLAVPAAAAEALYCAAYRSPRFGFNLGTLRLLFADLPILGLDGEDDPAAGEIRAELARSGTPVGLRDALIAGQAKARGLTLVTAGRGAFAGVDGLRVEDWSAE